MAFAYNTRRSTRDVDAVFEPKETVRTAAAAVADRRGISRDWLNDAMKGYLPGPDPDRRQAINLPGLTVDVASPRYLLAMKLLAARENDIEDITSLYEACGFTTAAEGLDLVEATYPRRLIPRGPSTSCRTCTRRPLIRTPRQPGPRRGVSGAGGHSTTQTASPEAWDHSAHASRRRGHRRDRRPHRSSASHRRWLRAAGNKRSCAQPTPVGRSVASRPLWAARRR